MQAAVGCTFACKVCCHVVKLIASLKCVISAELVALLLRAF